MNEIEIGCKKFNKVGMTNNSTLTKKENKSSLVPEGAIDSEVCVQAKNVHRSICTACMPIPVWSTSPSSATGILVYRVRPVRPWPDHLIFSAEWTSGLNKCAQITNHAHFEYPFNLCNHLERPAIATASTIYLV